MKQIIFVEGQGTLNVADREATLFAAGPWLSTVNGVTNSPWPCAGTIRNLAITIRTAPGAGKSITFTVMKNGSNTTLAVTISNTDTYAADTTHEISVAAGDLLSLRYNSADSLDRTPIYSIEFEGTSSTVSGYSISGGNSALLNWQTNYCGAFSTRIFDGTESSSHSICPISGTINNLYVKTGSRVSFGAAGYIFAFVVDGVLQDGSGDTVDTRITIIGTDEATTGNASFSLPITAGQTVSIAGYPTGGTPTNYINVGFGFQFTPTSAGQFILANSYFRAVDKTNPTYGVPVDYNGGFTIEASVTGFGAINPVVLKTFYVELSGAPGAGGSGDAYTFSLRKNDGNPTGALSVTISETSVTGNDTAHSIGIVSGDSFDVLITPVNTPANAPSAKYSFGATQGNALTLPVFDQYYRRQRQ